MVAADPILPIQSSSAAGLTLKCCGKDFPDRKALQLHHSLSSRSTVRIADWKCAELGS